MSFIAGMERRAMTVAAQAVAGGTFPHRGVWMYEVEHGQEVDKVEERDDAIELAKEISENSYNKVVVKDGKEVEKLTYRNGSLTQYLHDTRNRR
jgi:hypothetical protein